MKLGAAEVSRLLLGAAEAGGTAAAATVIGAPEGGMLGRRLVCIRESGILEARGSLGHSGLDEEATRLLEEAMEDPRAHDGIRRLPWAPRQEPTRTPAGESEIELFIEVRRPIRELVVVGAGHIAQPMAHLGALLGYRVTVLDDRPDFATRERFPDADRLVRADFSDPFADVELHVRTHLLLVTRGHKYDYECLIRALRADPPPAYIGMIGSRRRVRATYVQLIEEGIDRALIDRIHAPVGLDIGAETPEEIAVSVAAELVKLSRGGTGIPLKDVERVSERFFAAADEEDS